MDLCNVSKRITMLSMTSAVKLTKAKKLKEQNRQPVLSFTSFFHWFLILLKTVYAVADTAAHLWCLQFSYSFVNGDLGESTECTFLLSEENTTSSYSGCHSNASWVPVKKKKGLE